MKIYQSKYEDFKEIVQHLRNAVDLEDRNKLFERMWLILSDLSMCDVNSILADPSLKKYVKDISVSWCEYIAQKEKDFVKSKIIEKTSLTSILKIEEYVGVCEEFELLNKKSPDNILIVGSGPFPETLIESAKIFTHSHFFGLDVDEEAVLLSQKILGIYYKNMAEKISIVHADASRFNYSNMDVVFLANGLIGKSRVLKQIHETAPDNVSILVRNPIGSGILLYEDVMKDISHMCFRVEKSIQASSLSKTYLLRKK